MINVVEKNEDVRVVYDISLDGTVVNALGYNIISNTDGFNFQLPEKHRYTEENPYISNGQNRNTIKGKEYIGLNADVAEFNDMFLKGKMGLGIDEIVSSTINFSRKNYCDYFAENQEPKDVKMVGNTIKSKKMPGYIEKFLYDGIRLLLKNEGQKFIERYYKHINKIYNFEIPLKDIASRGKIKKSIKEYIADTKTLTKAGRPKSRQAWYELVIKNNLKVDMGDTIYYINTGKSKSHADVKKITHYYVTNDNGVKQDIIKDIEKNYKIYKKENSQNRNILDKNDWINVNYPNVIIEEEIVLNSFLLNRDIIDSEEEIFCDDLNIEYNAAKYIEQFNSRIKPLLVCFSPSIRDRILVDNPDNAQYFTEEESKLISGIPNKPTDQDTYEQLMTIEDKEIRFWHSINEEPPFVKECDMNWEEILDDYLKRTEEEKRNGISNERELYENIIDSLTREEVFNFIENGETPGALLKIADIDPSSNNFMSKKYENVILGTIYDITDKEFYENIED